MGSQIPRLDYADPVSQRGVTVAERDGELVITIPPPRGLKFRAGEEVLITFTVLMAVGVSVAVAGFAIWKKGVTCPTVFPLLLPLFLLFIFGILRQGQGSGKRPTIIRLTSQELHITLPGLVQRSALDERSVP